MARSSVHDDARVSAVKRSATPVSASVIGDAAATAAARSLAVI
jgi:hypothetical protein